tara:strand:+ start:2908 stop:5247 length:2340 start_codon:yes stop_codon:yes gene_type:complete
MATGWQTFPIEFRGGLLSNMSLLQQGLNAVGSASILQNFEVDKEGGYKKIKGFSKFTSTEIPGTGDVLGIKVISNARVIAARKVNSATVTARQTATADVNGAISSATALVLDRIRSHTGKSGTNTSGSGTGGTFDITNTNTTYSATVNAAGSGYAVGTTIKVLGTDLGGTSPANDATVTVASLAPNTYVNPTQSGYSGSGSSATFNITKTGTTYSVAITAAGSGFSASETITIIGTLLGGATTANDATITITTVNGSGGITGATIAGTGLADAVGAIGTISITGTGTDLGTIKAGMHVTGTGISAPCTVSAVTNQNNITLSTAQSLSDNTTLTFGDLATADIDKTAYYYSTNTDWIFTAVGTNTNGGKINHAEYNFDGDDKIIFVDGTSYPSLYNVTNNTQTNLTASSTNINTDVQGAERVVIFKNTAFYSKENNLYFTAPSTVDNFSIADGAGVINLAHDITGMSVFRDQLIIFTTSTISRLTGSSTADFQLQPITENIGCIDGDTVQEIGGDIMYLAPDGLRLLSATDRIGDFALDVASDKIKEDVSAFLAGSTAYCSTVLREKSQYRIFSFSSSGSVAAAEGLIATKKSAQGSAGIEWSTTRGIKAKVVDSVYNRSNSAETIAFANDDGYAYILDSGNTFDGTTIEAIMQTAFMPIDDPQIRKTFYKAVLFINPEAAIDLDFNLKFDFDSLTRKDILQPSSINITTSGNSVAFFGAIATNFSASGGKIFGSTLEKIYPTNVIGSGDTVALRVTDKTTNPSFTLDTCILEYKRNDRQ